MDTINSTFVSSAWIVYRLPASFLFFFLVSKGFLAHSPSDSGVLHYLGAFLVPALITYFVV